MRIGITLLPEHDWATDRTRWERVEALGFDHAWTYDHLAWRTLADGPWHATIPTLTAAALATERIRIGTLVTTPNFRHPVPLAKDLMTLDVIAGGRLSLAIGAGADGFDSTVMGQPPITPRQRHARFEEFASLLAELLATPVTTWSGEWYQAIEARMLPGPVQTPRPPMLIAANGPRGMRLAAERASVPGDGWVTLGKPGGAPMDGEWWSAVDQAAVGMDAVLATMRTAPSEMVRMLYLSTRLSSPSSLEILREDIARGAALGFTDVVLSWPRKGEPFAGDETVLELVADALPELRTA